MFGIEPGDNLIVLGDEAQGLAILMEKNFLEMMKMIPEETE